jgi:hypothetical protein
MDDAEIRKRVRERLDNGTLDTSYAERHTRVPGAGTPQATEHGTFDDACVVCDEGGTHLRYAKTTAAFHERCHTIWQEEVRKRGR